MAQPTSGTTAFNPSTAELVVDAFSRIQIRPTAFTAQHMKDAVMSASLLLTSEWSVRGGPNLWKIDLFQVPLVQGVQTYTIPAKVVSILDVYIRQFNLSSTVNLTDCYSVTSGSPTVTLEWTSHGQTPGDWIQISVQTAIGGLLLYGAYQVVTTPDANTLTFTATANATTTVTSSSGLTPYFTTTSAQYYVRVDLPNNGLGVGAQFAVPVQTIVGGLTLSQSYTVASITDSTTFYINATQVATSTESVFENSGSAQIGSASPTSGFQDRVITPISRTEYDSQPNKYQQSFPSTFWWDRSPATGGTSLTFWPVPDGNGPYSLYYHAMTQIEDVALAAAATLDLPARFLKAFTLGLAADLAWKYPPPPASGITPEKLDMLASRAWDWAAGQDTENVPIYIQPGLSGYFR